MRKEPDDKRAFTFIDGQNLYHAAKAAFGFTYPNFDPVALSQIVCRQNGWSVVKVNFYTGVPDNKIDPQWHRFWTQKLQVMGSRGVRTFTRPLRYSSERVILPNGRESTVLAGREKGIDVRIALDVVRMARHDMFDVALIFSQDQDLSEVAQEIREISREHDRWIKIACAFPVSPVVGDQRGINGTDWIRIDSKTYSACLDPLDYRAKK